MFAHIERAKSRVLVEQLAGSSLPAPAGVDRALLNQELHLLDEIRRLEQALTVGQGEVLELSKRLQQANQALEETWDRVAAAAPEGAAYVSLRKVVPLSPDNARGLIREGAAKTAIVQLYVAAERVIALIVYSHKSEIEYFSKTSSRSELRNLALVQPEAPPPADLRLPYWRLDFAPMLLEPLHDKLLDCERVCLSPHDVLHSLPLHALPLGNGSCLSDVAEVTYVPSVSSLRYIQHRADPALRPDLIIAAPARPDREVLLHASHEALEVGRELGVEPHLGSAATKELFLKRAGNSRYVHIACYGEFKPDAPMESALLLADGDLTAREVLASNARCELVVLSACETGASKVLAGDELMGLVRAFLYAGAPSVVVSLWNAYDESASELMVELYAGLGQGLTKAQALVRAQQSLRSRSYSDAQWAPFILVGDWR